MELQTQILSNRDEPCIKSVASRTFVKNAALVPPSFPLSLLGFHSRYLAPPSNAPLTRLRLIARKLSPRYLAPPSNAPLTRLRLIARKLSSRYLAPPSNAPLTRLRLIARKLSSRYLAPPSNAPAHEAPPHDSQT